MTKGKLKEENKTIGNKYAPYNEANKYIKQILRNIKGETDSNTIIVGDFNSSLSSMVRSSRQKINKKTKTSHDTLDYMDLLVIYRTFYPKAAEYVLFSIAHEIFSRIDHILDHTISLKFKNIEILSSIFSNHNTMRL